MPDKLATEYRRVPDPGEETDVTNAVVASVAAVAGVEPMALPPLQRSLDTDALAAIVGSDRDRDAGVTVRFTYAGYHVTVEGDGSVGIREPTRSN
ncbi:MAG TPA: HalOD1 output domain-containing protein [Halobacteriales archaeon]|nr:HalOD1 output domain-containing protein [Halobacteriales archaeon]